MLPAWLIILVVLGYLASLFALAHYGDQRAEAGRSLTRHATLYALSLAVYCTAWTFYGSVGRAASTGVGFLPIYLGPTLMAALWWLVLRKMIRISKAHRITSIADFAAARYGKSRLLGGLMTVVAVVGIVPYIALQLKAVSTSFTVLWHAPRVEGPPPALPPFYADTAFYVTLLLALFAILFGTRHLDVTEHHEGLVVAIAFESVIKLLAFLAIGIFVTWELYHGPGDLFALASQVPDLRPLLTMETGFGEWAWLTVLSMLAVLLLPRQFQMAVVENVDEAHLRRATWLFPLYLFAINLFVLPIALGGRLHFPAGGVDADTFVLSLPLAAGQPALALLVFIGGLSAATGMVIVETVALSTMVSNELAMPLLLRWGSARLTAQPDWTPLLRALRRGTILAILLLGYLYFRMTGTALTLVSIGLISFAAVAQFAPTVLGGMYWKGGTRRGALVGLSGGALVWAYTLPLPSLAEAGQLPIQFVTEGLGGIGWLRPYALFGLSEMDPISHSLFWSLLVNLGGYVLVSLWGQPRPMEQRQAALFVDVWRQPQGGETLFPLRARASLPDLEALLARFLGHARATALLAEVAEGRGWSHSVPAGTADADTVAFVERALAGSIGAASARVLVASVVQEEPLHLDEVMQMLDETSQLYAYSRKLEEKSRALEAATTELRAANERLRELDRLKDDFVSTVTHELRTPLTSIRGFAEILRDNPELDLDRRAQFLDIISKESRRLTRLINQVLDLAKIESGTIEWEPAPLDLKAIVEESLAATSQLFEERGVRVEVALPPGVPPVIADQDRLVQVMLNLLSNAAKFTTDRVAVRLRVLPDALQVDVSDNGPGVRPDEVEIVFEKFRQVGNTLTDKPQGTGLGLPISRHIVQHFGGQLWLESEPGHGATFSFTLPRHAPATIL